MSDAAPRPAPEVALQRYLHAHIPISGHLGATVAEATPDRVRLVAPLGANVNHRGTAFGGSISALAILAGWSLLHLRLQAVGGSWRIVIQRNTVEYLAPAESDFEAECAAPDPGEWERFLAMVEVRGRGRVDLAARVLSNGVVAATFAGRYVAMRLP